MDAHPTPEAMHIAPRLHVRMGFFWVGVPGVVVVVVVGLQESHLLWYGTALGSDPPSPLWYHRSVVGIENGHGFSAEENLWFSAAGPFG